MADQFQILLRKPGEDAVPVDVCSTDTIKDVKIRSGLPTARLFLVREFLKNTSTIQEHGITANTTLSALTTKVPAGFGSNAEYQSAMKLKRGETNTSRAHSHLHGETQSLVMAESAMGRALAAKNQTAVMERCDQLEKTWGRKLKNHQDVPEAKAKANLSRRRSSSSFQTQ